MATPQLSPGVLTREVDLTVGRAENVLDNIGGIAGPFELGPVNEPITVTTEQELINNFGKPKTEDNQYEYWMSGSSYLSYGGVLKVVRTDGANLANANVGVGTTSVVGVKIKNFDDYNSNFVNTAADFYYSAKNPGKWSNGLKVCFIDDFGDQVIGIATTSLASIGAQVGYAVTVDISGRVIPGTGTTAGSGGTIQNVSVKGAYFSSCTNISLKNMNFVGSNNAAISLLASTGIALDNISVTGANNNFGIKIDNVTNFTLSNSTLTGCGSNVPSSNVGGIYADNLKGTCSISNTNVNDSWGRGFYAYNNQGTSNITITTCQFKNSFNKANGGSNFIFEGYGTSNNTLVLKGNDFSNPKEYGVTLNFGGTSTNNIQVGGNTSPDGNVINAAALSPGSNGLSLQSNGLAIVNYNIINRSNG